MSARSVSDPSEGRPPGISWWALLKSTGSNWLKHKDSRLGAALAYYSIFSLGPMAIIAITIAGLFFGEGLVRSQVGESFKSLLGESGAHAVDTMLTGANADTTKGIIPTLIGVGALLFAAINVVVQLKDALNTVWEVKESEESGIWPLHSDLHPLDRGRRGGWLPRFSQQWANTSPTPCQLWCSNL